jgi:hypothetical protein
MSGATLLLPLHAFKAWTGTTAPLPYLTQHSVGGRDQLKCDGTRAETRFRLSAKRASPFKSAGASVQSTTGSRGVRITSYCW